MNSLITLDELQDKIQTLQPKTACGNDSILDTIIKYTEPQDRNTTRDKQIMGKQQDNY